MSFKLANNQIVSGEGFTLIDNIQYNLKLMSPSELSSIGVSYYNPPQPNVVNTEFYYISQEGAPVQKPVEEIKKILKNKVSFDRWNRENNGFLFGELNIPTDERTKLVMTAAYTRAKANSNYTIENFKLGDSYISIPNALIISIGEAMSDYIQACFTKNKIIDDQINALTTFEDAVNFTWSFNGFI